jgi:hypothetical protein
LNIGISTEESSNLWVITLPFICISPPLVKDAKAIGGVSDPLPPIIPALTNRGFTGHEHIDEMGLIHMNGRVMTHKLDSFFYSDFFV